MISPNQLDKIANAQEARGARIFFRALRTMYLDLARKYDQGQELRVNTDMIKKPLHQFYIQTMNESAEWQYNAMDKRLQSKAMQMGMYERINQAVRTWVMLNTGASITSISDTTLDLVKKMIADGKENGYGARKIAANIRAEAKGTFTAYRATVIARTEGTRAASQGHKLGAEQWEKVTGQKKWKAWSASGDSRTRDAHRSMIGSLPIPGDEDFIVDGSAMSFPGDPRGGAANCVSCRCRALYMSERIARQMRGEEMPGKVPSDVGQVVPDDPKPVAPVVTPPRKPAAPRKPKTPKPSTDPDIIDITPKPVKPVKPKPTAPAEPKNVPKGLATFKKQTGLKEVDESIFSMLERPVDLTLQAGGSYLNPQTMVVNLSPKMANGAKRSEWGAEALVYHEFGHAIDIQRGLGKSAQLKSLMDKHRNLYSQNNGYAKLHQKIMNEAVNARDPEVRAQVTAVADTLMSLNPKYGGGHDPAYMAREGNKEAEFIAHAFENEFKGNPYFKKVAPGLYKDMTAYIKSLK